jgi:peptidoglycan hydrolase-like protein with peptidoglycan-binding domain
MDVQRQNLTVNATGTAVAALHQRLSDLGLTVPASEQQQAVFGTGTKEAVTQFQTAHGLPATGTVDAPTSNAIDQMVRFFTYVVSGAVSSPDRAGVGGLHVQVVDKNVGPDMALGGAITDQQGRYQASVVILPAVLQRRQKTQPDLQVHVIAGSATLASSEVRYNASRNEVLNVLLPAGATALPSEYETLTATLATHFSGHLGDLQESADRQDVTFLANKSGWDARAVALAALADQFSRSAPATTTLPPGAASTVAAGGTEAAGAAGIKPDFYYALFRAGFPANADTLYQASPQTVGAVWQQAISQGVIPSALAGEVANALQAFQQLSAAHSLTAKPTIGISPLKDMLQLTFGTNEQSQQQFASLFTQYQHDVPTFWQEAQKTFGPDVTKRLQLDGQLGYLTLNNASLVGRLHDAEKRTPLGSTLDLAQRGYYQAAKWQPLLDAAVPDQIPGATPEERRANYAELLATQVRLTFPTAVVADMVLTGVAPVAGAADVRDGVHSFLTTNQGKFEIGIEPVERYLARAKLTGTVEAPVLAQVKRLQRVY